MERDEVVICFTIRLRETEDARIKAHQIAHHIKNSVRDITPSLGEGVVTFEATVTERAV